MRKVAVGPVAVPVLKQVLARDAAHLLGVADVLVAAWERVAIRAAVAKRACLRLGEGAAEGGCRSRGARRASAGELRKTTEEGGSRYGLRWLKPRFFSPAALPLSALVWRRLSCSGTNSTIVGGGLASAPLPSLAAVEGPSSRLAPALAFGWRGRLAMTVGWTTGDDGSSSSLGAGRSRPNGWYSVASASKPSSFEEGREVSTRVSRDREGGEAVRARRERTSSASRNGWRNSLSARISPALASSLRSMRSTFSSRAACHSRSSLSSWTRSARSLSSSSSGSPSASRRWFLARARSTVADEISTCCCRRSIDEVRNASASADSCCSGVSATASVSARVEWGVRLRSCSNWRCCSILCEGHGRGAASKEERQRPFIRGNGREGRRVRHAPARSAPSARPSRASRPTP